jgi:hypothetical protein
MNEPDILSAARQQLADAVSKSQPATCDPLNVSPWLAAALLQKAIRRGAHQLALQAAATLLRDDPDRFWRRCGGIAYEDIGLADVDAVAIVMAAIAGKRFRAQIGGEWSVASVIVSRMARAPKCRAADDLLLAADLHPSLETARRELSTLPTSELMRFATGSGPLPERAVALWYVCGTNWRTSPHLRPRRGEQGVAFDELATAGFPLPVVEIAREGFRKVGEILCPFVALLHPLKQSEATTIKDDPLPPETMIGEVPSWCLDVYSREGRAALHAFLQGDSETARWVRAHVPAARRVNFLGTVVFRVEGQLCLQRLRWPVADELRGLVDFECNGPNCPDATKILNLMRRDIPTLNGVRAGLMGGLDHVG